MLARVLARKWRPNSFEQLVGQEHITKTLINALSSQRLHHAYLFCGTRGVGKTTVARILAKSLCCEKGVTANACNECSTCQSIDQGSYADLIEVDAASRTKVEDTRELLGDMHFAPSNGRYKIYLIDEVHMLSNHSFNALLKTLEEPPPHVIFLFATTESQKLPVTVVSRCMKFNLKAISEQDIAAKLKEILPQEKIEFDDGSLTLISHYAIGSMRDALSLTDQAIAYCNGVLEKSKVEQMLGVDGMIPAEELLQHLADGNLEKILAVLQEMEIKGADFTELWNRIMLSIHKLSLILLGVGSDEAEAYKHLVNRFTKEELQLFYQIALMTKRELAWAPSLRSASEMGFVKLLTMQPLANLAVMAVPPRYDVAVAQDEAIVAHSTASDTKASRGDKEQQQVAEAPTETEEENEEQVEANEERPEEKEHAGKVSMTEDSDGQVEVSKEAPEGQDNEEEQDIEPSMTEDSDGQVEVSKEAPEGQDNEEEQDIEPLMTEDSDEQVEVSKEAPEGQDNKEEQDIEPLMTEDSDGQVEVSKEAPEGQDNKEEQDIEPSMAEEGDEQPEAPEASEEKQEEEGDEEEEVADARNDTTTSPQQSPRHDYTQAEDWANLVEELDLTGIAKSLIQETRVVEIHGGIWILHCYANVRERVTEELNDAIENALTLKLNQSVSIEFEVGPVEDTPTMIISSLRQKIIDNIKQEPIVTTMINKFGGKIDEESARPLK